ncbi:Uncharacterised protein [Mycobacterium tuberculosis]|nr:Uncharacterised protein [Mycobacterium tuberculosis]
MKAVRSNRVPSPWLLIERCEGTQATMPSRSQALACSPLSKPLSATTVRVSRSRLSLVALAIG